MEEGTVLAIMRLRRLAPASAAVMVAVGGVTACEVAGGLVGQAQARAMRPTIDAYLDKNADVILTGFGHLSPQLKPRVFCQASIIEISPAGSRWRVGMVMNCGEFARRGSALIEGASGYPGIGEVVVLSARRGRYHVLSLQVGPPYRDTRWVDSHFSAAAAARILSANPPTAPDPIRQAWRAFGFPAGTQATEE